MMNRHHYNNAARRNPRAEAGLPSFLAMGWQQAPTAARSPNLLDKTSQTLHRTVRRIGLPVFCNQTTKGNSWRPQPRADRDVYRSEIPDRRRPERIEDAPAGGQAGIPSPPWNRHWNAVAASARGPVHLPQPILLQWHLPDEFGDRQ